MGDADDAIYSIHLRHALQIRPHQHDTATAATCDRRATNDDTHAAGSDHEVSTS